MRWKFCLLTLIAAGSLGLFSGCATNSAAKTDTAISREEVSEEQFIEIASPDGAVMRQITDLDSIIEYIENIDILQWKELDTIPAQAALLYTFTSYEKVTDPYWLEQGSPKISVTKDALYQKDANYYIEMDSLNDNDTDFIVYEIPVSEGEYLTNIAKKSSAVQDKNDIFITWGIDDFDINRTENNTNGEKTGMVDEMMEDGISYSVEDMKRVSREQKIEIDFADTETKYTSTDLKTIADFYNNIKRNDWKEVSEIPSDKQEICTITIFQLERHTNNSHFIENETLVLYESKGEYFILDIIPPFSSEQEAMEIYYSVSADVAAYMEGFRS